MKTGPTTEPRVAEAQLTAGRAPPETGRESGTLLLASLAAAAFTAARLESATFPGWMLVQAVAAVAGPWTVWAWCRWAPAWRDWWDHGLSWALTVWTAWPLVGELLARSCGYGEATELVMLASLQNAAVLLGAFAHRRRCQQVACLLSGFLVLFSLVIGNRPVVLILTGLFGVLMLWWLMARYWEQLHRAQALAQVTRHMPLRWPVLLLTAGLACSVAAGVGAGGTATYVLRGFLPTSGGDRWSDPFARVGVGDGDALVAAREEAMSFGPVESELFLESDMPTLYDMFNDLYGEPLKTKKTHERAISLEPGNVRELEQRVARTQRSGREFALLRRRTEAQRRVLEDRDAPAMLYVVGQVPVHLGLETFAAYDGETWHHGPVAERQPPPSLERHGDRPWVHFQRLGSAPIHRGIRSHVAKIINLKTQRVPSPPQLAAVHIDRLEQADFFGWTDDGMAAMTAREHIPQLTVMHLRSQGLHLEPLRAPNPDAATADPDTPHAALPAASERLRRLAAEWLAHVPSGWLQVEAVVQRLRTEFVLDATEPPVPPGRDPVEHFLERRCGPDYVFATTAALMLRQLGYPTRLVTGFYARPERYDRVAGQTAVLSQDAHVWLEVRSAGGTWVTIEPTPGYEPPQEDLTWSEQLQRWARLVGVWVASHLAELTLLLGLAVGIWWQRVWCLDVLAYALWRILTSGGCQRRVRWTIHLLEWRCSWAGRPRPPIVTLSRWYGRLQTRLPADAAGALRQFLRAAEQTLYAPSGFHSGLAAAELDLACRCVARHITGRYLKS